MKRRSALVAYLFGFSLGAILTALLAWQLYDLDFAGLEAKVARIMDARFFDEDQQEGESEDAIRNLPSHRVLAELKDKGAVYDNTRNITGHGLGYHQSFAVAPHSVLGWWMRPNVEVDAHFMAPAERYNLDPPVLYLDAKKEYSAAVQAYLRQEGRRSYHITSDAQGFRITLPSVVSERKVLVVGDSVAFGLGVNDNDTLPSQLQRELVDDYQVINGALSGFETPNNLKMIDLFADKPVDHLVYVICANDVFDRGLVRGTLEIMEELEKVRNRYKTITVVLHHYMYEILPRFFYPRERERHESQMLALDREINARARKLRMTFINWHDIATAHMRAAGTEFAGFGLYVDHCHFSPLGNRLLAAAILDQSIRGN